MSTPPRGSSQAEPPSRPTEITALLGRGTQFEGKLLFDGRVRVDGHFRGDIRGEDVLVIGEGAHIVGTIEVATCIVTAGLVEADIRARDAIELYSPATVTGNLHAPAIFIDRGVQFQGNCKMAPLDDDSESMDEAPTVTGTDGDAAVPGAGLDIPDAEPTDPEAV